MKLARRTAVLVFLGVALLCLAACSAADPQNRKPPADADILLFVGSGTSPGDVAAVERVLRDNRFSYSTANSRQLNAMNQSQLQAYRLLIVPGGNFEVIGKTLTPDASANIRGAVRGGVNYLGICAGAFFAGNSPYNGLDLTGGVRFDFYALEAQGIRKSAVPIAIAGMPTSDHYWEDGPQLSGWGDIVAKYPDGSPAIVEGSAGAGWVILTGTHPEAPESWRRGMTFATPASETNAYAAVLVDAALNGTRLPHY
ncbi:MAG: BPL-N domain-containing protein [Hyphomonadaceae bacterium]|nr:BPL-N domain-containing protein [Hyphomonadaceae bacterium]